MKIRKQSLRPKVGRNFLHKSYLSEDNLVTIWLSHSEKLWRTVYATPIIAAPIAIGWNSLRLNDEKTLEIAMAVVFFFAMLFQLLIVKRMSDYDSYFFHNIIKSIKTLPPKSRINGRFLALAVPFFLWLTSIGILIYSLITAYPVVCDQPLIFVQS